MTMKVECYGCGEDCSHAYGTYNGYPCHFGCLPVKGGGQNRRFTLSPSRQSRLIPLNAAAKSDMVVVITYVAAQKELIP